MAISIPRKFVEQILLGQFDNRRQLQDSPILTDVWIAFAKDPDKPQEMLITPAKRESAGKVAHLIDARVNRTGAEIAPLQGVIAAKLYFDEVLRVIVPMTEWWKDERVRKQINAYDTEQAVAERLNGAINRIVEIGECMKTDSQDGPSLDMLPAIDRMFALAGLILWAREQTLRERTDNALAEALDDTSQGKIFYTLFDLFEEIKSSEMKGKALVRLISLNRTATAAVARSVPAVKADAARALFHVDCSTITWAVVDSGIKGDHPAFRDGKSKDSRVDASFDFSNIRKIVSLDNLRILSTRDPDDEEAKTLRQKRLNELRHDKLLHKPSEKRAISILRGLAEDAKNKLAVDWDFVRSFVEIKRETAPDVSDHGTHVAGIIGSSRQPPDTPSGSEDNADGMCPDIRLYDFRVLAPSLKETEFAIIAALQFIRYLNERTDYMLIHGANLSLSIPHDVRNYGCGRTPVCLECERLVDSGVVVVAAAGNYGYHSFTTSEGAYEGYASLSITDPGNADGVITVGATHRYSPHTYGVSFFSSRGPTGDGRLKPDLVAPGERIRAPIREDWGDLDGTSMAAPHVSGAAAMLMARYSELIGQPRRIKQILCDSATDLGRERSFQGRGMLDVLRAFQSV